MDAFGIIIWVFFLAMFLMVGFMLFMPKVKNNMLERQMKSAKNMLEGNKDTLKELSRATIDLQKELLDENENALKELSSKRADIESVGLEKKAAAVKRGLTDTKKCKFCDAIIEADSIFCKECGKKQ